MTSKYSTNLTIPDEFPQILKDFTREVLREQPANIYQVLVNYHTSFNSIYYYSIYYFITYSLVSLVQIILQLS